jgi:hypothetical protein
VRIAAIMAAVQRREARLDAAGPGYVRDLRTQKRAVRRLVRMLRTRLRKQWSVEDRDLLRQIHYGAWPWVQETR